jgi:GNAT superfamily N-acetyltransferase
MSELHCRVATEGDLDQLNALMARAIAQLQGEFLTAEEIDASQHVMGLDTQLVRDGTYLLAEADGQIAGCGGWSWRSTLYGGDASVVAREPYALDPASDAARIRAMYTDPRFARRGVGRRILNACEEAARAYGFHKVEMMATLAGAALYRVCGYHEIEHIRTAPIKGVVVPMIRMGKSLD